MQNKQPMQSEQLVQIAIAALEDLKAQDITTIDVRDKTSITDFMLIASGTSSRRIASLAAILSPIMRIWSGDGPMQMLYDPQTGDLRALPPAAPSHAGRC